MKIAVANTKGGVGKTTTAMLLGVAAAERGYSVEVWDSDPQGSATMWAMTAEDAETPLPFPVRSVNASHLKRLAEGKRVSDAEVLIIDTPPGGADVVQLATDGADFVVVPTLASAMDMQRVWSTLDAASHRYRAVLLTSAEARTTAHTAAINILREADQPVLDTAIPKRQAVRGLFGTRPGASDLFHYDEVLTEIEEVLR